MGSEKKDDGQPETIRISRTTGDRLRRIGDDLPEGQSLEEIAEALRQKNREAGR